MSALARSSSQLLPGMLPPVAEAARKRSVRKSVVMKKRSASTPGGGARAGQYLPKPSLPVLRTS